MVWITCFIPVFIILKTFYDYISAYPPTDANNKIQSVTINKTLHVSAPRNRTKGVTKQRHESSKRQRKHYTAHTVMTRLTLWAYMALFSNSHSSYPCAGICRSFNSCYELHFIMCVCWWIYIYIYTAIKDIHSFKIKNYQTI